MRIREIISQHRRDFRAIYECEHCGAKEDGSGYDDENYHRNVIPSKVCLKCGKAVPENYRALTTKYPEGTQV